MKMPLDTEVDLSPGHIVLDRDPAPPTKGVQQPAPLFLAHVYCGHGHPSPLLLSSCCKYWYCLKLIVILITNFDIFQLRIIKLGDRLILYYLQFNRW